uniref:Guanine nucleotide-binding protein subunit gamma n=1 Tax=Monopterus albus TaxID=43700 RepID=A0A3Q3JMF5_MONAL
MQKCTGSVSLDFRSVNVAVFVARMKGDTPVNSTMSVGQARKLVEQLKIEASFCRIKVSKAAADLMAYCDAHACDDPLITPVPTSENPFREKKFFCALL